MKTRIYMAGYGQRYTIIEKECACIVLRKLPNDEYSDYYRERVNELYMDATYEYWLPIHFTGEPEEAVRYLREIGVDCGTREVSPCKEGEGSFPERTRRHDIDINKLNVSGRRAVRWIATEDIPSN